MENGKWKLEKGMEKTKHGKRVWKGLGKRLNMEQNLEKDLEKDWKCMCMNV